ncbi:MAG: phosphoribosylanthranilate isomerase [Solirubrobacterales bacterium]
MTTKVKICGITSVEDAERSTELGAWAVGCIFHRPSPRRCRPTEAARIAAAVRRRALVAGVFVNHPLDEIVRLHERVGFELVQLHGDEGPAFCSEVARRTGAKVIRAVRVRDAGDVRALDAFRSVDYHLLDSARSGETVDPALLRVRRADIPLVLAGGLTPANVGAAIAAAGPFAVDVARGVEAEPGRKEPARLEAFFAAVAAADGAATPARPAEEARG